MCISYLVMLASLDFPWLLLLFFFFFFDVLFYCLFVCLFCFHLFCSVESFLQRDSCNKANFFSILLIPEMFPAGL